MPAVRRRSHFQAMSVSAMSFVWKHSRQRGGSLLVLLALADFANDEGLCYPSMQTLALKARVDERQARRIVAKLVKSGEASIEQRGGFSAGRNLANVYRVRVEFIGGGKMPPPGKTPPPWGQKVPKGGGAITPPTVRNHHTTPRAGARPLSFLSKQQSELETKIALVVGEIREILHPGGSAGQVYPSSPEKLARYNSLVARRETLQGRLDSIRERMREAS